MKLPPPDHYPKTLAINTEQYKVKFAKLIQKNPLTLGLCDPGTHVIWIKKGMGKTETFSTLIHEVLHAIEFEYNLKIKHELIHDIEMPLAKFFLDNF